MDTEELSPATAEGTREPSRRRSGRAESIRAALEYAEGFISAQSLHELLIARGGNVSLATVYRRLTTLVESGDADTVAHDGRQLYRACRSHRDHLHLICESCGSAATVIPPAGDWITSAAAAHGYAVTRLEMNAFGRCAECRVAA